LNIRLRIEYYKEALKEKAFIVLLFLALAVFAYLQMPSIDSTTSNAVYGKVIGLRGAEGDGVRLFLDVKLDSGKNVLVSIPYRASYYKKNERLRMQKRKSNILGGSEYTFEHYVAKDKI